MKEIMNNCIIYLREVWNVPLARDLVLIIATATITHFFESRKRKEEQKQKFKSVIGEKVSNALSDVRDVVVNIKTYEIYTTDGTAPSDEAKDSDAFGNTSFYPSFMNDKESLLDFCKKISSLRSDYEQYLDLKSASYLYALEKYLLSLVLYIREKQLEDYLNLVGCFVIVDIQRWEKRFDIHLVKQINKPHYKLFSRHGVKWSIAKWCVEKWYLEKTELYKVMRGVSTFPIDALIASLESKKEP